MEPRRDEVVWVLRQAARFWWRDFAEFQLPGDRMNTTAVRDMLMATCGTINSGIGESEKRVARYFENLERPQKLDLLKEAMARYQEA